MPFGIRASRSVPVEGNVSVSLVWLPEARSGEAFVSVLADGGRAPTIVSSSLEPASPPPVAAGRYQDARAVFSYGYRDLDVGGLVVRDAAAETPEDLIWAWKAEIDSRFAPSGKANHTVRYLLENTGAPEASVALPAHIAASQIREVRIDGNEVAWDAARAEKTTQCVCAPLPPGEKYVHLRISFDASCPAFGLCGRVDIPELTPDFDVLKTAWIARFAPGYLPIAGPGARPGICHRLASLMGPFAARWTTTRPAPFLAPEPATAPRADSDSLGNGVSTAGFGPTPDRSDSRGWTPFRFRPASDGRNTLAVVHRPRMDALGYAALLATVGLGIGVFRSARAFWVSGTGACVIAALLVPPTFLGVVSGAFLGCLGVAASGLFRDMAGRSDFEQGPAHSVPPGGGRMYLFVLAWVFLGTAVAGAAEPSAARKTDRSETSTVYPVLIPFDGDSKNGDSKNGDSENGNSENADSAKGADRVLVPEPLYRELHRRDAIKRGDSPITLVSASYDCELTWSVDEEDLVPREWRLRYEVTNRARSAELVLPIKSTEGVVRPDGVRVDGRLTAWRTAAGLMRVPIGEPGKHRVEVLVRPKVLTSDGTHVAAVGIPPVPSAEATVTTPANGPRVAVTSALGENAARPAHRKDARPARTGDVTCPGVETVAAARRDGVRRRRFARSALAPHRAAVGSFERPIVRPGIVAGDQIARSDVEREPPPVGSGSGRDNRMETPSREARRRVPHSR